METLKQKSTFNFYEQIIINSIHLDAYNIPTIENNFDNINKVYKIFKKEYLYTANLKRYKTEVNLFAEWLKGLPSVLTVPFYNYDILELGKNYGLINESPSEARESIFLEKYWINLSISFFTLKNNL